MTERLELLIMGLQGYHDKYRGDATRAKGALLMKQAAEALTQQNATIEQLLRETQQQDRTIDELKRKAKA